MPRRAHVAVFALFAASWAAVITDGCAATSVHPGVGGSGGTGGQTSSSSSGMESSSTGKGGEGGFIIVNPDGGDASDAVEELITNPCGSKCGPVELCDEAHLGLDDNCDGQVDEGCSCTAGQAHSCFRGDPSYHNAPGCYDGTELCTEQGSWGPCIGGVHAVPPDNCFLNDTSACHAISTPPYADVHLKTGTGNFSANATPGSEKYTVQCPSGVSQCPMVTTPDDFKPLQSGEYTVTYSKLVAGDANPHTCTFPLFVGAPGLRVELSWEHTIADDGVDLDLHVHQPNNSAPWGVSPGVPQDCTWNNCVYSDFEPPQSFNSPHWFTDTNMVPNPVNWDIDNLVVQNNTCYNDPRGVGVEWAGLGMGCHNPRLDVDDITCDYSITDPNNYSFCTPENINVDYPPNGQWLRVGVHYYNNHDHNYDVHPEVKIFCNGALAADLGPQGFYMPEAPVTFESTDGEGTGQGNRFWVVADVAFTADMCGRQTCVVKPIFSDENNKTPYLTLDTAATTSFQPAWPPPP